MRTGKIWIAIELPCFTKGIFCFLIIFIFAPQTSCVSPRRTVCDFLELVDRNYSRIWPDVPPGMPKRIGKQ